MIPKLILKAFIACYGDDRKLSEVIDRRLPAKDAWQGDEHGLQRSFFEWLSTLYQNPDYDPVDLWLVHAIPNGGGRTERQGSMLKAEGLKGGVPDIFVPVPRGGFAGLYMELKNHAGSPKPEQRHFLRALQARGYMCVVCNDLDSLKAIFEDYMLDA